MHNLRHSQANQSESHVRLHVGLMRRHFGLIAVVLATIGAAAFWPLPAEKVKAADELYSGSNGSINLELPTFRGPTNSNATRAPSAAHNPSSLPVYRGPGAGVPSQYGRPSTYSKIQIIPGRNQQKGQMPPTSFGRPPTEPLPFSPTRSGKAEPLGRVNPSPQDPSFGSDVSLANPGGMHLGIPSHVSNAPSEHAKASRPQRPTHQFGGGNLPSIMPNTTHRLAQRLEQYRYKPRSSADENSIPLPQLEIDAAEFDLSAGSAQNNTGTNELSNGIVPDNGTPQAMTSGDETEAWSVLPDPKYMKNAPVTLAQSGKRERRPEPAVTPAVPSFRREGTPPVPSPSRAADSLQRMLDLQESYTGTPVPQDPASLPPAAATQQDSPKLNFELQPEPSDREAATHSFPNNSSSGIAPRPQGKRDPVSEFEPFRLPEDLQSPAPNPREELAPQLPAVEKKSNTPSAGAEVAPDRFSIAPQDTPPIPSNHQSNQVPQRQFYSAPIPQSPIPQAPIYQSPAYSPPVLQLPPPPVQQPVYGVQNAPPIISPPVLSQPATGYPGHLPGGHSIGGSYPGTSGFRATVESDAPAWLSPYQQRASVADSTSIVEAVRNLPMLPQGFTPWWDASVRQSTGPGGTSIPVDVGTLLQDAMLHSPQVTAIKAEPEVQYRVITQEEAKFDWTAFLETTYDDFNDPVGNTLTTADGSDRLLTRRLRASGGLRRRNIHGGEFRIAQDIGHENQSSTFFVPNNQGTTRLELSYRQPLLDGLGEAYNRSEIILASIAANSSEDEVATALQDHLIEVTDAYWALYRSRAEFFQRQKLLQSARNVLARLRGRSQVDTIPRQVLRANAAVARAQTRIQRTLARVEDAESQLRLLVNSPGMLTGGPVEVLPQESPNMVTETADLQSVLHAALVNRPDISEAIRKMRASTVRLGVSKQELLPRLDLLVETYVSDLAGNSDVGRAFGGQFSDNRPGYSVGLELEIPLENRAAIAKLEQRQWELKRSINVFRATVERSLTDTEVARREVATAYSEIVSRYHSMMAAEQESRYLADRFTVLPASEDSATLLLEDLLDSFERLADEESSFVQAQVDHAIALVKLKKEMGVLLRSRHARPELGHTEQQFMDQRLQTSASRRPGGQAPSSANVASQSVPQQQPRTSPTRVVGHQLGGPPVAAYTTTWSRQPPSEPAPQSRPQQFQQQPIPAYGNGYRAP